MRCFIALRTDGSEREALAPWLERAAAGGELAVTPVSNLHVTLAFLGEVDGAQAEVASAVAAAAAAVAPARLELRWSAPGVFPSRSRPRVFWLGVDDSAGDLAALHRVVTEGLASGGLRVEARRFRPHLTLARLRRPGLDHDSVASLLALLQAAPTPAPSPVEAVTLFQSHLGGGPARHEPVSESRLSVEGRLAVDG